MIDLADNLPTLDPEPVSLGGETFLIRRDLAPHEREMARNFSFEDNDLAVFALVVLEDRAPILRDLINRYPVIQGEYIARRVLIIAGLLPEEAS
ncbi:hypothetical protein [Pseudonocardia sp.]|uniref:hypothetical protein n=1 Tax=Pseudonocardia sp. TaxID=60912 RepID=UPI003D0FF037